MERGIRSEKHRHTWTPSRPLSAVLSTLSCELRAGQTWGGCRVGLRVGQPLARRPGGDAGTGPEILALVTASPVTCREGVPFPLVRPLFSDQPAPCGNAEVCGARCPGPE